MRRTIYFAMLLALPVLAVGGGRAGAAEQMLVNSAEGLKFARDHCAKCHEVEPEQAQTIFPAAKRFVDIAADPKMTALSLRVFLRTPHFDMPDLILTEAQTDDVIAYILSLK